MSSGVGGVLLARGVISDDVLQNATVMHQRDGIDLAQALVAMGAVTEQQVLAAVAEHAGLPVLDTSVGQVDPSAASLVPRTVARELQALPIAFHGDDALVVAISDPGNIAALHRIGAITGMAIRPGLTLAADLEMAIEHLADDLSAPPVNGAAATADWAEQMDPTLLAYEQGQIVDLNAVLIELVERRGSDVHLTAGLPPMIRVDGELEPLKDYPVLTPGELQKMLYGIITQKQREIFENALELDASYHVPGLARFRVNIFQQRDSIGSVMRVIPVDITSLDDLGIPQQVKKFATMPRGFVLVTGPTGSGKSTTLAGLIDIINKERACHIMTVEDPIEFLHHHQRSVVNQRELGTDTHSFAAALKHVVRQDPDVILVGEMRDLETIQVALTAAETGHLVFGTLHTQDAPQTIDRVIDVFPPHQQEQIRVMLAGALQGVVCQQLVKNRDGDGRTVACEVMFATPAIRNLIREGKTHQMYSALQAGKQHGMITIDQSLANLVLAGKVSYEAALEKSNNVTDFNRLCGRS
jgi:twitching motility protein PilT